MSELPAGWVGPRGEGRPAEVLALGNESGGLFAAISLRLVGRALRLRLRGITDSLSQQVGFCGGFPNSTGSVCFRSRK